MPDARSASATHATLRRRRRHTWEPAFLEQLGRNANVRSACEAAGINRTSAYRARWSDAEFARLWDEAIETGCDRLEEALFRRAVDGVPRTVFYQGDPIGEEVTYSDTAAIFLLKGHRKEKYAERSDQRHSGPGGGAIPVQVTGDIDLNLLTNDELRTLDELYAQAEARSRQNGAGAKEPA